MSKAADTNLWGIHAGKTGDADSLFLKRDCRPPWFTSLTNKYISNSERELL